MINIQRVVYRLIVKIHPRGFRRQFEDEMMFDFDDALTRYGFGDLCNDVILSLMRQWMAWAFQDPLEEEAAGRTSLITGDYMLVSQESMTVFELMRGSVLSGLLFGAVALAVTPAHGTTLPMKRTLKLLHTAISQPAATQPAAPRTETGVTRGNIAIRDVTVIDVQRGVLKAHQTVVIAGGRITSVGGANRAKVPAGADEIDGRGRFLIPGLWDMHTHITRTDVDFPVYLANGVLGIRNMGGVQERVFAWKKELVDGTLPGPMAFVSGPILDSPTGPTEPASYALRVANGAEARAAVDMLKAKGADFIKVYDGLSRESYFAIADETKKVGMPFVGHVPSSITILEAVRAGQRSIEHGIEARGESTAEEELIERSQTENVMAEAMRTKNYSLIPENIARKGNLWLAEFNQERADSLYREIARRGTYLCPTLVVQHWIADGDAMADKPDSRQQYIQPKTLPYWLPSNNMLTKYRTPAYIEWVKTRYAKSLEQIPREQAAGVQFLTGTDLTVPYIYPGFSVHDEMKMFVSAGLTPLQALQAATTHPVEFLGLQQSMGSIAAGKMAEVVLVDGNPLTNIGNVDRITAVITHGRLLRRGELDAMMVGAAKAAQSGK